jgi:hypothetical protein
MSASPNMEAKSELLSLETPLKYGQLSIKLDIAYLMQTYIHGTCVDN